MRNAQGEAAVWGAHAPSRALFGASPKSLSEKVREGEGALASTRGACAPQA